MGEYLKEDETYLEGGKRICKIKGCGKKHYAGGFCKYCYYSRRKQQAQHKKAQKKYEELHKFEKKEYNKEQYLDKKKEVLADEGYEGIMKSIKALNSYKLDLLRDFLLGKAYIIHHDDLQAVETVKRWILRMGSVLTDGYEKSLKSPNVSEKVKADMRKELLGRIIPPKQEITVEEKKSKLTVDELLTKSIKIIEVVEKGVKHEGMIRRIPGRPSKED